MADQDHLGIFRQGDEVWNRWRKQNPNIHPNLSEALLGASWADYTRVNFSKVNLMKTLFDGSNLSGIDFHGAFLHKASLIFVNLREANLSAADLYESHLEAADLTGANLAHANLGGAHVTSAKLGGANLQGANLRGVDFRGASLKGANLSNADLRGANLSLADLSEANLTGCHVFAVSAWDVQLDHAIQAGLIITPDEQTAITVDDLEVAQFIYLLLKNQKIRNVIDTITSKVVLILGRFTPERKIILDAIREELGKRNYTPVLFDFEKPANRDLTETVSILAHLARFIIVDLTDPSSAPHEVATIIPHCIVPVQPLLSLQPLIVDGKAVETQEYAMFDDLRRRHPWVLPTFRYQDTADLLASIKGHIIEPAEHKAKELTQQ